MDRITVRGKGGNVYLTGHADVCWGGRPVGARAFCTGCHGAKDNRDVDRSKCGPLILIDRLAAYEDAMPLERAQELAQAEKDGRLVVLPCKVGDTVYEANKRGFVSIYEVISIHVSSYSILVGWNLVDGIYSNLNGFEVSALGKTVFLTRAEAEAALKKREEADNEAD